MKGKFEAFWADRNMVKIDGAWFKLAPIIKAQYVEATPQNAIVSFSIDKMDDKTITFFKQEFSSGGDNSFRTPKVYQNAISPRSEDKDKLIIRQSCLKAAVELWVGKEVVLEVKPLQDKTNPILTIAEEFERWVWRNDKQEHSEQNGEVGSSRG